MTVQDVEKQKPLLSSFISEYSSLLNHAERSSTEPQRMTWRRSAFEAQSESDEAGDESVRPAEQQQAESSSAHVDLLGNRQQQQLMAWANEDTAAAEQLNAGMLRLIIMTLRVNCCIANACCPIFGTR